MTTKTKCECGCGSINQEELLGLLQKHLRVTVESAFVDAHDPGNNQSVTVSLWWDKELVTKDYDTVMIGV